MTADLEGYARYAIYAAPDPAGPLGGFGASWLGWDAAAGAPVARPAIDDLPEPIDALTVDAARYGFHGTLKAPFRLAEGATPVALAQALADLAAATPPVPGLALELSNMHGFVALRPTERSPALDAVAMACVEGLDDFRAPLTEAELTKRRAAPLTPRQDAALGRWGYPYVGADFHFHLTLTKRQSTDAAERTIARLRPHLAEALATPHTLDALCLFGDPGGGDHFRLLRRCRLTG